MSALAFVQKIETVEILTDSLSLNVDDARVVDIASKQVFIGSSGVIATNGWALPCDIFTNLISENCSDYDELISLAEMVWAGVNAEILNHFPQNEFRSDPYLFFVALVGWSENRQRPESYILDSCSGLGLQPVAAFACGGGEAVQEDVSSFIHRFHREPEAFSGVNDGLPLFENMRRSPSKIENAECQTVGGSLHHTIINRTGVKTKLIRTWPDRVGEYMGVAHGCQ